MAKDKRQKKADNTFGVIVDFAEAVDTAFERLTGKPVSAWLEEFRQRPQELPPGEGIASSDTMPLADAYAVLGLTPNAPLEQVKKHYRNLAKAFHSDVGTAMNDEAMKLLNRARDRVEKEKAK